MVWKIVLAIGVLGILLGLCVTGVSVALPVMTNGRTSWEEALFGIIPGLIVLLFSFFLGVLGLIFVLKNRKRS